MTGPQPPNAVPGMWLPTVGVQAAPHTMGLLASARRPSAEDPHWVGGFAWRPETCIEPQGLNRCDDIGELPPEDPDDLVYYQPPGFRVDWTCQTRTVRDEDVDIVRRKCEAVTEFQVAHELWTGALTGAAPYQAPTGSQTVNFALADATAVDVTPTPGTAVTSPAEALGLIEQAAMEASHGQQVVIHSTHTVAEMTPYNFRVVGNMVFTERGNIVIASGGYDGTSPAGDAPAAGTSWMYATGIVQVRLTDIDVITDPVQTINRDTNTRTIWAQRYFAATFDPCIHVALLTSTAAIQ